MFECSEAMTHVTARRDPRLRSDYLRCIPGETESGSILLIGVVHDHPASLFRVATLLEELAPDVLALELPSLAVPLFRRYANDGYTPPRMGGEMSTALQAAGPVRTVGIDSPNRNYLSLLARRLVSGHLPRSVLPDVVRDLTSSSLQAIACRLGALVASISGLRLRLYLHIQYDSSLFDAPSEQAAHEASHLAKQQAFLRSIVVPRARQLIDEIRDDSMATQLLDLRLEGDVIAVVGMEHLDPLSERLRRADSAGLGTG